MILHLLDTNDNDSSDARQNKKFRGESFARNDNTVESNYNTKTCLTVTSNINETDVIEFGNQNTDQENNITTPTNIDSCPGSQWLDDTSIGQAWNELVNSSSDALTAKDVDTISLFDEDKFEEDDAIVTTSNQHSNALVMTSVPTCRDSFSTILGKFLRQVPFQVADIWVPVTITPNCNVLVLGGSASLQNELTNWGIYSRDFYFKPQVGIPGRVLNQSAPEAQQDVTSLTRQTFPRLDGARALGLRASLGIPVRSTDGSKMVVVFYSKDAFVASPELVRYTEELLSKWNFRANITLLSDTESMTRGEAIIPNNGV